MKTYLIDKTRFRLKHFHIKKKKSCFMLLLSIGILSYGLLEAFLENKFKYTHVLTPRYTGTDLFSSEQTIHYFQFSSSSKKM